MMMARFLNNAFVGWCMFILLEFLVFLLAVPTLYDEYVYWGISETDFYYVDDQIPYLDKTFFLISRLFFRHTPLPTIQIPLDKITGLKLYSRQVNSYLGLYAFPIYFTLNLCDGGQFEGACLIADDKTIANIFTEILAKGARLDDPEGLLVLLQDPEISASHALEQRFREKRGMRQ